MSTHRPLLALLAAVTLAACGRDIAAPDATAPAPRPPSFLLGPDESVRMISDSTDARGNEIMVAEYAAGVYLNLSDDPLGVGGSVASVTIKTVIPAITAGSSSGPCITSSIVQIQTTSGWVSSVKKPGGCDKEIVVGLENRTRNVKAQFSFLYIFGKTRIDSGLIR
jgi:hypothetical protein